MAETGRGEVSEAKRTGKRLELTLFFAGTG
jgi:hypothetical protein